MCGRTVAFCLGFAFLIPLSIQASKLPPRCCMPTKYAPFVFFHQRNCGALALWEELFNSVRTQGLTAYLPNPAAPQPIARRTWQQQVLAGFFTIDYIVSEAPPFMREHKLSCVTVMRDPVERVQSCIKASLNAGPLEWGDLTAKQIGNLLTGTHTGRVCTNEPLRIFSGIASEHILSGLHKNPVLAKEMVDLAQQELSRCVVLMQEDLDKPVTVRILNHWFPWFLGSNHTSVGRAGHTEPAHDVLTEDKEAVITSVLAAEIALYEATRRLYEEQIQYLDTVGAVKPCPGRITSE